MLRLSDHIVAAGGWLSIARMMELALYHPTDGYYSASIQNIGPRGDFSTTATLSPILAKALVTQWKDACKACGTKLPFLEIGAGNASLAMTIADELGFWKRLSTDYLIVESSPNLRDLQHMALGSFASIYADIQHALKACHGKVFIFSNELVDAFPARVFEFTQDGWQEVGLTVKDGHIAEQCRKPEQFPNSPIFEYETNIGQRVEIHESYLDWFRSWIPSWQLGVMTTIDYGDEFPKLYERKPKGTLRAYYKHHLFTGRDVYANAGKMDITCDVNFSDLLVICSQCLGDEVSLVTQKDYLSPYASNSPQDAYLTSEFGAGSEFKVLIQKRLATPAGH